MPHKKLTIILKKAAVRHPVYSCFLSLLVISQNKTFNLKENYLP